MNAISWLRLPLEQESAKLLPLPEQDSLQPRQLEQGHEQRDLGFGRWQFLKPSLRRDPKPGLGLLDPPVELGQNLRNRVALGVQATRSQRMRPGCGEPLSTSLPSTSRNPRLSFPNSEPSPSMSTTTRTPASQPSPVTTPAILREPSSLRPIAPSAMS